MNTTPANHLSQLRTIGRSAFRHFIIYITKTHQKFSPKGNFLHKKVSNRSSIRDFR